MELAFSSVAITSFGADLILRFSQSLAHGAIPGFFIGGPTAI